MRESNEDEKWKAHMENQDQSVLQAAFTVNKTKGLPAQGAHAVEGHQGLLLVLRHCARVSCSSIPVSLPRPGLWTFSLESRLCINKGCLAKANMTTDAINTTLIQTHLHFPLPLPI